MNVKESLISQIEFDKWRPDTLTISPDGTRIAYVTIDAGKVRVVIDGIPGTPYDGIAAGKPVFSPDSRRVAYAALQGTKQHVVVDGETGPGYDAIPEGSPLFSSNSAHVAYGAQRGSQWFVVVDHVEGLPCSAIGSSGPTFSSTGERVAYSAVRNGRRIVIVDEAEQGPYSKSGDLTFSPDGTRIAYWAGYRDRWFVVTDGVPGRMYDGIHYPVFSPDSKHVAYSAERARPSGVQRLAVIDEVEGKPYDQIGGLGVKNGFVYGHTITFSPNSNHVAYVARHRNGTQSVVLDEKEGKAYNRIGWAGGHQYDDPIIYSPDGEHIAYAASKQAPSNQQPQGGLFRLWQSILGQRSTSGEPSGGLFGSPNVVVTDGQDGEIYRGIELQTVTFRSHERVAYWARKNDGSHVFVDGGVEAVRHDAKCEDIELEKIFYSPSKTRRAFMAKRDEQWFLSVDGVAGNSYDNLWSPIFSPDSQHIACGVERNVRWFVTVDGIEQTDLGYDGFLSQPVFASSTVLSVWAHRDAALYRITFEF